MEKIGRDGEVGVRGRRFAGTQLHRYRRYAERRVASSWIWSRKAGERETLICLQIPPLDLR